MRPRIFYEFRSSFSWTISVNINVVSRKGSTMNHNNVLNLYRHFCNFDGPKINKYYWLLYIVPKVSLLPAMPPNRCINMFPLNDSTILCMPNGPNNPLIYLILRQGIHSMCEDLNKERIKSGKLTFKFRILPNTSFNVLQKKKKKA